MYLFTHRTCGVLVYSQEVWCTCLLTGSVVYLLTHRKCGVSNYSQLVLQSTVVMVEVPTTSLEGGGVLLVVVELCHPAQRGEGRRWEGGREGMCEKDEGRGVGKVWMRRGMEACERGRGWERKKGTLGKGLGAGRCSKQHSTDRT